MGGTTINETGRTALDALNRVLAVVEKAYPTMEPDSPLMVFSPSRKKVYVYEFVREGEHGQTFGVRPKAEPTTNLAGEAAISVTRMYHKDKAERKVWLAIVHLHT